MAQTHCNTVSAISQGLVIRMTLAQYYSLLHHFHMQRNNTSLKKKKINCPQQSTYTFLENYGLRTLLYQANKEQGGLRGIHRCACAFHYSHQVFWESLSSNDPVPWGCRTIFTHACQYGSRTRWINGITQYEETLSGFKRLQGKGTANGLEERCWNNQCLT